MVRRGNQCGSIIEELVAWKILKKRAHTNSLSGLKISSVSCLQ